ncbi:Mov34/MPN/PAD-1 family protein [Aliiglaciecola lipolytica]|uniref:JAB domain-containing protein n=1 Tax=Aliiglaciecola lipolytica E3 TaxID=1127673 RepID=K6Y4Q3_9ALTE|nr:Mov34/MPN/PAD-1 family protein [Aliiglaciecola lipolytica]GAC13227.1 hypothetical protein GLIP_0581 [Aliiglaciecola lipolytica E3]
MFVLNSEMATNGKTKVHVPLELLNIWRDNRQLDKDSYEAFGALIGSQSECASEFWLNTCTLPQKQDSATRTSFNLRASHHQRVVDSYFKSSKGTLGYVGTWHTHPQHTPIPSNVDISDWRECIKRNPDRRLLFVIIGQVNMCIFREVEGIFECVYKEEIDE